MDRSHYVQRFTYLALLLSIFIFSSCATTTTDTTSPMPPISNNVEGHSDIILPSDLKWDSSKSMAIITDSFTGGIYQFSGGIELNSLKEFIKASMANNKWKLVGEASYKNVMLAFIKPNKTCMVFLTEGFGGSLADTDVSLYVTVDLAAAKGLNPFGEPIN